MVKQYYYVQWLDVYRISKKVGTAKEACEDCFGMVSKNMRVKPIGIRKYFIYTDEGRAYINSEDGWRKILI